jgi:hypothetical protein
MGENGRETWEISSLEPDQAARRAGSVQREGIERMAGPLSWSSSSKAIGSRARCEEVAGRDCFLCRQAKPKRPAAATASKTREDGSGTAEVHWSTKSPPGPLPTLVLKEPAAPVPLVP